MTPEQIHIVQTTWLRLLPIKDVAARLFYDRLFELDPSVKRMFRADIREQGQKLMQVIDAAVNGLSRFEQIVPMIQAIGRRHAVYGVQDHHYGIVGDALLWTLQKGLGAEFTPQVRDAWTIVYGTLATTMREAAAPGVGNVPPRARAAQQVGAAIPQPQPRGQAAPVTAGRKRWIYLAGVCGIAAIIGLGFKSTAGTALSDQRMTAAAPATLDAPRFLLNAFLAPALDPDVVPLRWVEPRRFMRCGLDTMVKINGEPLVPGALVPNLPFEMEWHSDGCRPFGKYGPRLDGRVKFTVFREDWGFSAMVEPMALRVVSAAGQAIWIEPGAVTLPRNPQAADALAASVD